MQPKKPFSQKEFRQIYSKVPRLSVDVIVTGPKGVAFTLRSIEPYRGMWHFPGSTLLYSETPIVAAHRVARDELGVSIHAPTFLGYIEYDEVPQRGFGYSVSLVFTAKLRAGKLAPDEDATRAEFFAQPPPHLIPMQKKFLVSHRDTLFP